MRIAFLLCVCTCYGQFAKTQSTHPVTEQYAAAIRFNFTGLADPIDNNISLGGEFSVHPQWSVIADLAYIEYSGYFTKVRSTSGYIIKPAIRYYPTSLQHKGFFEAVLFYKKAHYNLRDWLGKDCVNGVQSYEQFQEFSYNKQVSGFNLQMGIQTALSRNKQLQFEGFLGLGIRVRQQDVAAQENCCYNLDRGFGDINGTSGTAVLSSFPLGMRIVYCIRR